jgi:hypothetical protein
MPASELATLVEAEQRLDAALGDARRHADSIRALANQRAATMVARVDESIAAERARIAADIAAATSARVREIEDRARAEVAHYDAVQGEHLDAIAATIATRIAETVLAEELP